LKIDEESWNARGKCSTQELKEATRKSMMVLPLKDIFSSKLAAKDASCRTGIPDSSTSDSAY
jgi:hypothetical protein